MYFDAEQSWTTSYYLGVGTLFLAILAFIHVQDRRVRVLGAVAVLSLVLALGQHGYLYAWLRKSFPQFDMMRFPIKFVALLAFAVPIPAGLAARRLGASPAGTARSAWRTGMIVAGILLGLISATLWFDHRYPLFPQFWRATLENGVGRIVFLALALGTLAIGGTLEQVRLKVVAYLALLLALFTDVICHMPRQNPTVPRAAFEPGLVKLHPPPRLGESRAFMTFPAHVKLLYTFTGTPLNDYIVSRLGLFLNCNLLDDIPQAHGFFALYLREPEKVREALNGAGEKPPARLCDFLGVSQMTAPGKYYDWQSRSSCLPLVTAGQRIVFADDDAAFRALTATNFSPQQVVYLPSEARSAIEFTNASRIKIVSTRFSAHRVEIELEAKEPGMVVIAQSYYHPWRASIDGRREKIRRANLAYQALQMPAGRHRVTLSYRDDNFLCGIAISGLALTGCVLAMRPVAANWFVQKQNPTFGRNSNTGPPGI